MGRGAPAGFSCASAVAVTLLAVLFETIPGNAQPTSSLPPPGPAPAPARALDALLQDYAFRAFARPRTGEVYQADVPANLSGIALSAVRLRSGSFRNRGFPYNEFNLPVGVVVTPYVLRLALVYHNLGNWSRTYYGAIPGYTLVTPVVGLLVYSAADLSAKELPALTISPTANAISVNLAGLSSVPLSGRQAPPTMCVHFPLDGSYRITALVAGNLCTTTDQGHFALLVNSTALAPSPAPSISPAPPSPAGAPPTNSRGENKVWKIAAAVVGGFLGLILLALLLLWTRRFRHRKKMTHMIKESEAGEELKAQRIGNAQLPAAPIIRTRPTLENDYVP